ncbi:hypothetical protein ABZ349_22255 [Streptomyces niveus]|uniref:hypothetical protein n=1 Tax=Streptomyces niveus TaxID=193462 RepID=UPI0033F8068B
MKLVKKRPWALKVLAAAVGGLLVGTLVGAPAQAEERRQAGIALTALAVEQDTVDATSGSATVTVDWTMTDGNAAATDMFGAITVQQVGDDGGLFGAPHDLTFSFQPRWPYQANPVAGTMASADYSYDFPVPQYAVGSTARWAVVKVTARDDQGGTATVGRQKLADFDAEFTATHLVDSTGPTHDSFGFVLDQPKYLYNADESVTARYQVFISDAESGFFRGQLLLSGPQGAAVSGSMRLVPGDDGSSKCGEYEAYDNHDVFCTVDVTIPAGAPAGNWSASRLRLTDAAGNVSVIRDLSQEPVSVHVTRNETLRASEFAISPEQFNNWNLPARVTVKLKPSGVRDGIRSVTVLSEECWGSATENPVIAPDGTISVQITAGPIYTRKCTITGIGLTDGAGNSAAYGAAFQGPALSLVATQIPHNTPPVVNAASLDRTTFSADSLPDSARLTLDVTSFVGVTQFSLTVYDADGASVDGRSGGLSPVTEGPLVLSVPLNGGLEPGVYTVGFTVTDVAGLRAPYGYPGGNRPTPPGGPLLITVTD